MNQANIISTLPESVTCHILSRLSTKKSVRTSVLSTDWRNKWTTAYNIDITDCDLYRQRIGKQTFLNFMDRILAFPHDLKSFRLLYRRHYANECFINWISAVIRRNVESFELQRLDGTCFVLPISLVSNSTSLRTLKLTRIDVKVSCVNSFPHLTDLYLDEVKILNEESDSNQLGLSFPELKTFVLNACKWPDVEVVEIYSPTLRTFKCDRPLRFGRYWEMGGSNHVIKICGARLEKFESGGYFPENISLHDSMVRNAALRGFPMNHHVEYGLQARKLMDGFSNVVKLELSFTMCEAIAQSKQAIRLPKFDRLLKLEMCIGRNADLLLELLHSAPVLELLKIDNDKGTIIFDFVEEEPVPYCVTSHLKEVVFINCSYNPIIHLAKFFLKNGLELKKVYIEDEHSEQDAVMKIVKTFPKASADAEIFPPGSFLY